VALTAGLKWEDYEERCERARVALMDSKPSQKDRLRREYQEALQGLQDYLKERYGWMQPR